MVNLIKVTKEEDVIMKPIETKKFKDSLTNKIKEKKLPFVSTSGSI